MQGPNAATQAARGMKCHYLPRFYLRGFTQSGGASDQLYVFNKQTRTRRRRPPAAVAYREDLYRADVGGQDNPYEIEGLLGDWERKTSQILRHKVSVAPGSMTPESFNDLMLFVASLNVRSPLVADNMRTRLQSPPDDYIRTHLFNRSGIEKLRSDLSKLGIAMPAALQQHFATALCGSRVLDPSEQNLFLMWMLLGVKESLPFLKTRQWAVLTSCASASHLVCSDMPARIWHDTSSPIDWTKNPEKLRIFCPLDKRTVLIGGPERRPGLGVLTAEQVIGANGYSVRQATRFIFAPEESFRYEVEGGKTAHSDELWSR